MKLYVVDTYRVGYLTKRGKVGIILLSFSIENYFESIGYENVAKFSIKTNRPQRKYDRVICRCVRDKGESKNYVKYQINEESPAVLCRMRLKSLFGKIPEIFYLKILKVKKDKDIDIYDRIKALAD